LLAACPFSKRGWHLVRAFVAVAILTKQWALSPAIPIVQPVFFAMLAFGLGYAGGPMIASIVPAREALPDADEDPGADDPLLRPRRVDRAARAPG
jgi:hypothetical protein